MPMAPSSHFVSLKTASTGQELSSNSVISISPRSLS